MIPTLIYVVPYDLGRSGLFFKIVVVILSSKLQTRKTHWNSCTSMLQAYVILITQRRNRSFAELERQKNCDYFKSSFCYYEIHGLSRFNFLICLKTELPSFHLTFWAAGSWDPWMVAIWSKYFKSFETISLPIKLKLEIMDIHGVMHQVRDAWISTFYTRKR